MFPSRLTALILSTLLVACSDGKAASASDPAGKSAAAPVANAAAPAVTDSTALLADRGRTLGSDNAKLWMLVVSDFQCPWCKRWHDETFALVKKEYVDTGKLRLAYVNFPLGIHPNAWPSAISAMCASAQGKFWATHDKIFLTQAKWEKLPDPTPFLDSLAVASGADAAKQRECTSKKVTQDLVISDQNRANKSGAQTTPTFFIGGAMIEGAQPIAMFRHVIDSVLAASPKAK